MKGLGNNGYLNLTLFSLQGKRRDMIAVSAYFVYCTNKYTMVVHELNVSFCLPWYCSSCMVVFLLCCVDAP